MVSVGAVVVSVVVTSEVTVESVLRVVSSGTVVITVVVPSVVVIIMGRLVSSGVVVTDSGSDSTTGVVVTGGSVRMPLFIRLGSNTAQPMAMHAQAAIAAYFE